MFVFRDAFRLCITLILGCLVFTGVVYAQDAILIAFGQNVPGEVTADAAIVRFSLAASGGETATVEVLGFTPGFAPRFRVLDPADVEILTVDNPDGLTTVSGAASFASAGLYTIEVEGESGTTGQFLLSLRPGAALPAPLTLAIGQAVEAVAGSEAPVLAYEFSASPAGPLTLSIVSKQPTHGPGVTLRNQTEARTIASSDGSLSRLAYTLPPSSALYRVEVRAASAGTDTRFTICLSEGIGTCEVGAAPVDIGIPVPTTAAQTCMVVSATGGAVNVRSGPDTGFGIVGSLLAAQTYPVVGQLTGGGWYQVSLNGQSGWVAASVVRLEGGCDALPAVAAPANAPPAIMPTLTPAAPPPAAPTIAAPPPTAVPPTAMPPSPAPSGPTATDLPPLSNPDNALQQVERADVVPGDMTVSVISEDGLLVGFVVHNTGSADAGVFSFEICNRAGCAVGSAGPIAAGGHWMGSSVLLPVDAMHVTGQLTFTVDINNSVSETNEGNNVREQTY